MASEQHPVELIMARGFMSNLTTPAFLIDADGVLVFYNESAGDLFGISYEEAGPMPAAEWGTRFEPVADDGSPVPVEELPISVALSEGRPAHRGLCIRSVDGEERTIEVTAFPIMGRSGLTGALAVFWSPPD